jgi:hypothetical protein
VNVVEPEPLAVTAASVTKTTTTGHSKDDTPIVDAFKASSAAHSDATEAVHYTTTEQQQIGDTNPDSDAVFANVMQNDTMVGEEGVEDDTTDLQKTVMKIITIKDFVT